MGGSDLVMGTSCGEKSINQVKGRWGPGEVRFALLQSR